MSVLGLFRSPRHSERNKRASKDSSGDWERLPELVSHLLCGPEGEYVDLQLRSIFGRDPLKYNPATSLDDCLGERQAILLCITPRSGSTYLGELMESTGKLGLTAEYLNLSDLTAGGFATQNGLHSMRSSYTRDSWSLDTYFRCVIDQFSAKAGVFSMKGDFFQYLALIRAGLIRAGLKKVHFVYLTREDVLAQALSLYRATQSGKWSSLHTAQAQAQYDAHGILQQVQYLISMMGRWELVFNLLGFHPLRLTYERLIAEPVAVVQQIAGLAGVSVRKSELISSLRPLRDNLSAEWEHRLRNDVETCIRELPSVGAKPLKSNSAPIKANGWQRRTRDGRSCL
jgi:LPS sulfotransferase NodH